MICKEIKNIITKFIHDEVGKTGLKNVVIGLSGGVDSSVVATLAVKALGKDRVIGILMPATNFDMLNANYKDAQNLASSLDIKHITIPVSTIVNPYYLTFIEGGQNGKLRIGNIRARSRMTILYDQAMTRNALVLGTTNKTEFLLGYFTKYGDGGVDIEPIADLYKTEVFKLARYINISDEIVNKPPSADLWDGQTDEEELGLKYSEADQILWWLIEEDYDALSLEANLERLTTISDKNLLGKLVYIMSKNHHKTHMPKSCRIGNIDIRNTMANCGRDIND